VARYLYGNIYGEVTHSLEFCFPKTEDTAAIDPVDSVLKLPEPVVAGSSCRIVTDFGMDLLGYSVN
jgi:hypothetical protein